MAEGAAATTASSPTSASTTPFESRRVLLVKLGGSVLTDKGRLETLRADALERIASTVASFWRRHGSRVALVLVHGAGSFGHFQARTHRLRDGGGVDAEPAAVALGVADTRQSVQRLHVEVLRALVRHGVPAMGVSAFGLWRTRARGRVVVASPWSSVLRGMLDRGMVPVLHGDVVEDEDVGVSVLSGDTILAHVAAEVARDRSSRPLDPTPTRSAANAEVLWTERGESVSGGAVVRGDGGGGGHRRPLHVAFVSDVDGLFTADPSASDARFVQRVRIAVSDAPEESAAPSLAFDIEAPASPSPPCDATHAAAAAVASLDAPAPALHPSGASDVDGGRGVVLEDRWVHDVTGGIRGKVESMVAIAGCEAVTSVSLMGLGDRGLGAWLAAASDASYEDEAIGELSVRATRFCVVRGRESSL